MDNPWEAILAQLEPMYEDLKARMNRGQEICADLSQRGREWCIVLQEQPLAHGNIPDWADSGNLDERVNWSIDQLQEWPGVRRMAYDMWHFKRKRDAEKFQTLYNLKWAG